MKPPFPAQAGAFGMPTTVFMAANGDIVSQKSGFMRADEIDDRIAEMIDASG